MTHAVGSISMMLGAGFSTISTAVLVGTGASSTLGLFALAPVVLGAIIAYDELPSSTPHLPPDGLTDEEIESLKEGADA
jgi:hypothetical protein